MVEALIHIPETETSQFPTHCKSTDIFQRLFKTNVKGNGTLQSIHVLP